MKITQLIESALNLQPSAIAYSINKELALLYPDQFILNSTSCDFNVEAFAREGHCQLQIAADPHPQILTHWLGEAFPLGKSGEIACLEVMWQGYSLSVLQMAWQGRAGREHYDWVWAENEAIVNSFFATVCQWHSEIRGAVLIYENGSWSKSEELFQAIQSTTFDNLILAGTLKQDIRKDLETFFASEALYAEYGIPWKRGVLFVGSPGNGKTHTVKALINDLEKPCLYVKNFRSYYDSDSASSIRAVFERARASAPCVLVLEDLDSLVTAENRSFFLNELDGFALNQGILTLATTNYPERLDPAIIDRPSRFDRKYHFNLPAMTERAAYIQLWNDRLKPMMRLSPSAISTVAEETEGFSFAYLKELFLSSMMAWVNAQPGGQMDEVMRSQAAKLKEQMSSTAQDHSEV